MSNILDGGLNGSPKKMSWTVLTFKVGDKWIFYHAHYSKRASTLGKLLMQKTTFLFIMVDVNECLTHLSDDKICVGQWVARLHPKSNEMMYTHQSLNHNKQRNNYYDSCSDQHCWHILQTFTWQLKTGNSNDWSIEQVGSLILMTFGAWLV